MFSSCFLVRSPMGAPKLWSASPSPPSLPPSFPSVPIGRCRSPPCLGSPLACSPALVFACAALRSSSEPPLFVSSSPQLSFQLRSSSPRSSFVRMVSLVAAFVAAYLSDCSPHTRMDFGVARVCVSSFPPPSHPQCLALLPASAARSSSACPPTSR